MGNSREREGEPRRRRGRGRERWRKRFKVSVGKIDKLQSLIRAETLSEDDCR